MSKSFNADERPRNYREMLVKTGDDMGDCSQPTDEPMTLRIITDDEARKQLNYDEMFTDSLWNAGPWIWWPYDKKSPNPLDNVYLDGEFTLMDLEAIVYWMRTYGDTAK